MPEIQSSFDTMRAGPPATGSFPPNEINTSAGNYWGDTSEKRFVLPFWKADQLIAASPSAELALKVTNIANPAIVDATWVSFDTNNPDGTGSNASSGGGFINWLIDFLQSLLPAAPVIDANYYIIGPSLYSATGNENFKQFTPHNRMTIVARLGKTQGDRQVVYFNVNELDQQGGGPGGPGTATGAKIPADDGDE